MTAAPPPRRFRFGLRTLFVVVVIASIPCAWVGYSLNWIRQRHEVLDNEWPEFNRHWRRYLAIGFNERAPGGLWLFGERGVEALAIGLRPGEEYIEVRVRLLFPESKLRVFHSGAQTDTHIRADLSDSTTREAVEAINRLVTEDEEKRAKSGQLTDQDLDQPTN